MSFTSTTQLLEILIADIKRGEAVRTALLTAIASIKGPLHVQLKEWFENYNEGKDTQYIYDRLFYIENVNLFVLLEYGLDGYPILQNLERLKDEVVIIEESRMEERVQTLPYKMMIPLFLFFFPALMWTFLAPFIREIARGF